MKVALIGKGTSAIITALILLKNNHQVTIYYDPNTPHISVGESTTPHIQKLIQDVLGLSIHDMVDSGIFSYKMGINFVNWGCGKQFHHNFPTGGVGHHFETKEFNAFIHEYLENNNIVKYIAKRVDNYKCVNLNYVEIDGKRYDFVVNCAGWEDDSNYHTPVFNTVNSALLFTDELDDSPNHTLHLATEDGWQFGLPFPAQNKLKCGYLYNNAYISESDVRDKLTKEIRASFSWKPRYAKEVLVHKRIALNGNRLFFLEPLQALSLFYTHQFAEMICEFLDNMTPENMMVINHKYLYEMWCYQFSLAYHYQFGSLYDSQFWRDTQSSAKQFMKYSFNGNEDIFTQNLDYDSHLSNLNIKNAIFELSKIGIFSHRDHYYIFNGMRGNKINLSQR